MDIRNENQRKCFKITERAETADALHIADSVYVPQDATEEEIKVGGRCLEQWLIERKYKTQICSPDRPRPYYDMVSEILPLRFEELIFDREKCIGVCRDGLVFIFEDKSTHYREKYLGEVPTSHDQSISFYDYYYLRVK